MSMLRGTKIGRPKRVTLIGTFLILWNGFMIWVRYINLPLQYNLPRSLTLLMAFTSIYSLFAILGIALLFRKRWARIAYLTLAPTSLGLNLVLGCFRLGVENIYDRIPSIIVTSTLMALLLSQRSKEWFNISSPKSKGHLDEEPEQAANSTIPSTTLEEKASGAATLFRILMETMQTRLENMYPNVMLMPHWNQFVVAGTVAGCTALALRLHNDVPEQDRTTTELKMREHLQHRFPDSEHLYEECYRFMTQSLMDIPRPERPSLIFPFLAMWVVAAVSESVDIDGQENIVAELAEVYLNETSGYWKSATTD